MPPQPEPISSTRWPGSTSQLGRRCGVSWPAAPLRGWRPDGRNRRRNIAGRCRERGRRGARRDRSDGRRCASRLAASIWLRRCISDADLAQAAQGQFAEIARGCPEGEAGAGRRSSRVSMMSRPSTNNSPSFSSGWRQSASWAAASANRNRDLGFAAVAEGECLTPGGGHRQGPASDRARESRS